MPTLLRDTHFVLERYAAPAFVRLARTAEPITGPTQVERSLFMCRAQLAELDLGALGILIDWRLSPQPDDDGGERVAELAAEAFAAPFGRAAVLLLAAATWSGSDAHLRLFSDEEAAIAYVSAT